MIACYDCREHGSRIHLAEGERPPRSIPCHWCARRARYVGGPPSAGLVTITPDIPEHFNLSLNRPVRSRRHLRDLQARMGTVDYEGIRGAGLSRIFTEGGVTRKIRESDRARRR